MLCRYNLCFKSIGHLILLALAQSQHLESEIYVVCFVQFLRIRSYSRHLGLEKRLSTM